MLTTIWAILLVAALAAGWVLTMLGMPGNWLIVVAAAIYAWAVPNGSRLAISWQAVAVLAGLALLGEIVELVAGALGVSKAGGSRRSAVLALLGSIAGAIVGIFSGGVVTLPIPIVGALVLAVLFAGLGALGGAMLGESWKGRSLDQSLKVGHAAFWGRIFGTLAKVLIGTMMAVIALVALILQ